MSDWQPIETAPKDGTIIRVRQDQFAPFHVFWKDGYWRTIEFFGGRPTHWKSEPPA